LPTRGDILPGFAASSPGGVWLSAGWRRPWSASCACRTVGDPSARRASRPRRTTG